MDREKRLQRRLNEIIGFGMTFGFTFSPMHLPYLVEGLEKEIPPAPIKEKGDIEPCRATK